MNTANIKISPVNIDERKSLAIHSGDTVKVWQKIVEKSGEKEKTRLQAFEGLVISVKHGTEAGGTFTVRKTIDGVGVERIFPLFSPVIDKIEVLRRARVRRSKLYHIREKAAKEIRRQMRSELRSSRVSAEVLVKPEEVAEAEKTESNEAAEVKTTS